MFSPPQPTNSAVPTVVSLMASTARVKKDESSVSLSVLAMITVGMPQFVSAMCQFVDVQDGDGLIRTMRLTATLRGGAVDQYEVRLSDARDFDIPLDEVPYTYRRLQTQFQYR